MVASMLAFGTNLGIGVGVGGSGVFVGGTGVGGTGVFVCNSGVLVGGTGVGVGDEVADWVELCFLSLWI